MPRGYKLTAEDINLIHLGIEQKVPQKEIAVLFGVSEGVVSYVKHQRGRKRCVTCNEPTSRGKPFCLEHLFEGWYPAQIRSEIENDPDLLGEWYTKGKQHQRYPISPEVEADIVQRLQSGETRVAIVREYGDKRITIDAIRWIARKHNLINKSRRLAASAKKQILELAEQHLTHRQIAVIVGRDEGTISRVLKAANKPSRIRWGKKLGKEISLRVLAGEDVNAVAAEFEMPPKYVHLLVRRWRDRLTSTGS